MRPIALIGVIAALAFPLSARATDGLSALLDTGYVYNLTPGGRERDAEQYSVRGAVLFTLDNPGFAVQLDGGDDIFVDSGRIDHLWSADGSAFWRDNKGTIGLSGSYSAINGPAQPFFKTGSWTESYSAFGEYYVFNNLTLQIKGGGTTQSAGSNGHFGGGGLTFYDNPDLAFHTEAIYTSFSSEHSWSEVSSLEYLPFGSIPLSVYAGYDWSHTSGTGSMSSLFAGLRFRFGPTRALVDDHRTGPIDWTGHVPPGAGLTF